MDANRPNGKLRFNSRPQDGDLGYYNAVGYVGPGPLWTQWASPAVDGGDAHISKMHIRGVRGLLCGSKFRGSPLAKLIETAGHCERCKTAWAAGKR